MFLEEYKNCKLCARLCGVDRYAKCGFCGMPAELYVSRSALHFWEEPPISGERGSGTVFFTGCSLCCAFCQNRVISKDHRGERITVEELSDVMLKLKNEGAHNINLVTPTHYSPSIVKAVSLAKEKGLNIPIIYNTGSYDRAETIQLLNGTVDVYLADMKYFLPKTAEALSLASDYPTVAMEAIDEMVRQVGECVFDENGLIIKGVIIRILLLPAHVAEAKLILKSIFDKYGDRVYISLMSQYTPMPGMKKPLDRRVLREEYRQLLSYADKLGVTNAFIQDIESSDEKYIPPFIT